MIEAHTHTSRTLGLVFYTRDGSPNTESAYEKPVLLPAADQADPALQAWADARFALDIMAEHAQFFALLMPPEVAGAERVEAQRFHATLSALCERIDAAGAPARSSLKAFADEVVEAIKPIIEY